MSPHKGECVRCVDSRNDLNYSEIPDSWNDKEKTKMANFNEKINSHKEFFLLDSEHDYVIKRIGSMDMLESEFDYNMRYLKIDYRLFIQYKDTCPAQEMAGRCCMWSCTSNTRCGFGNPKFDYIAGAVLITDKYVVTYGDTWFKAVDLEEKHVVCNAYVCGRFVSELRIPAEVFDRLFGLKENFPKQYTKPVQEENDLIEKANRNVELYKDSLYSTKKMIKRTVELMQGAIIEIEDMSDQAIELIQGALINIKSRKRELDVILSELNNTFYELT